MLVDSDGDLIEDYAAYLKAGSHLAVMPIARVEVGWTPLTYPGGVTFYPTGLADLRNLNVVPISQKTPSLADICSAASGIDTTILSHHPLVVFPYNSDWEQLFSSSHNSHLEFIRSLSEYVDQACLNFIRYRQCPIEPIDSLPGRAGQVNSNHMMAGALLYNPTLGESRIIGGSAFTHFVTRGLGLPLEPIDHSLFPKNGEVGCIINHALYLYSALLEASNLTSRFIQALSLLEFLAYPDEYRKFEDVKKVIARYVAKDQSDYKKLLERFFELTGKKEQNTDRVIGYRTRMVHMGERIEEIVPDAQARRELFLELDGYIKAVMAHMIAHSEKSLDEYLLVREALRPYEK